MTKTDAHAASSRAINNMLNNKETTMTKTDDSRRLDLITYEIEKKAHKCRNDASQTVTNVTKHPRLRNSSRPELDSMKAISDNLVWNTEQVFIEVAKAVEYWDLFQQVECYEVVQHVTDWLKHEQSRLAYQAAGLPSCSTSRMANLQRDAHIAARNQIHLEVTAICERVNSMSLDEVQTACADYEAEYE